MNGIFTTAVFYALWYTDLGGLPDLVQPYWLFPEAPATFCLIGGSLVLVATLWSFVRNMIDTVSIASSAF